MFPNLQITTRTLLAGILALALGVTASRALAQAPAPRITMEQAERIALDHVPGSTVESIERDSEGGTVVYEVELRAADGVEHEIVIDANDGRVIRAEVDDRDDD